MPFKEGQKSLTGFLSEVPLKQALKKKRFGGQYLHLWDYFLTLTFQFESGAILGRAKHDKINTLTNMLVVPGTEINKFTKFMHDKANGHLEKYRSEHGTEPNTFYDFIFDIELKRVFGSSLNKVYEEYMHRNKEVVKLFDHKVSLDIAWPGIEGCGMGGVGFGCSFPELTEKMYKNATEYIDTGKWTEARRYGVDIPRNPNVVSFEEREESVLAIVAAYTSEYYPELVDPLDLQPHDNGAL